MLICWVDGGAKPNPGSLYGSFKIFKDGVLTVHKQLLFVDKGTNNQAEYLSLIALLDYLIQLDTTESILINMDSRLVIKQILNEYATLAWNLIPLKEAAANKLLQLEGIEFKHVPREHIKNILGH